MIGLETILATVVVGLLVYILLGGGKNNRLPRGFRLPPRSDIPDTTKRVEVTRDNFKPRKVPENLDAVVIGSGMGGLACAAYLARAGKRVLVLEQHYITGGCTHAFEEHGVEFDTGLHYIGNPQGMKKLLDPIITGPEIHFAQMGTKQDGYVYDEVIFGDEKPFCFPSGKEAVIQALIDRFPDEAVAIRTYINLCETVSNSMRIWYVAKILPRWITAVFGRFLFAKYLGYAKMNAPQVIDTLTSNVELKRILLTQFVDAGGPPEDVSFAIQAAISNHYFAGGYYPVGGSLVFSRGMIPTIERSGGRVLVRAPVEKILFDNNGHANGVRVNEMDIHAPIVVSACGYENTFRKLVPKTIVEKHDLLSPVESIEASPGHMYLFVVIDGSQTELQLPSSNRISIPVSKNQTISEYVREYYNSPTKDDTKLGVFIGFPSAKDPSWEERYPTKSCAIVMAEAHGEWFKKWEGQKSGKRGEEYEAFKKKWWGDKMMEELYKFAPQIKDRVTHSFVASPATNSFYLNAIKGESYGLSNSVARHEAEWLRPDTHIEGLYLTGQDIASPGISGAFHGGYLTALSILGYPSVFDLLTGRDIDKDFQKMKTLMELE